MCMLQNSYKELIRKSGGSRSFNWNAGTEALQDCKGLCADKIMNKDEKKVEIGSDVNCWP